MTWRNFLCVGVMSLGFLNIGWGQLWSTNNGEVSFFSKTPMMDISAKSLSVQGVLKTSTNEVAVRINNKSFKFENSLMEEHFNEKYMESEKFPVSTFAGKIQEKIDYTKLGEVPLSVSVNGKLSIHGVEQVRTILGTLELGKNGMIFKGVFKVKLDDFKIEKPTIVFKEIADEIDVRVSIVLSEKK